MKYVFLDKEYIKINYLIYIKSAKKLPSPLGRNYLAQQFDCWV